MADLPPLQHGKVVGRFLANTADGPDIDTLPEFQPMQGTITFTAAPEKILVYGAEPDPATVVQLPEHYIASLDEFGYLTWRGERGIRLISPEVETNPANWTWRISFDLTFDGRPVPMAAFSITVPPYTPGPNPAAPDVDSVGLVDLTLVSPVPGSEGDAVVRGLSVVGVTIVGDALVFELDNGDTLDPVVVPSIAASAANAAAAAAAAVDADAARDDAQAAAASFSLTVGTVTTGAPGDPASLSVTGTAPSYVLNGTLPKGDTGLTGPPAPDADATTKGILQLAGDLGGTAASPTVPGLAGKAATVHTHVAADLSDSTATGRAVLTAADAAAARTAIGAGTSSLVLGTTSGTAAAGDDARLSDSRTPTAAGQVYDMTIKSHMGARATGAGNVIPEGVRIERAISISQITWRGQTAGTGNLIVELRKNGSNTGMPAASTISAANHTADTVVTAGGPWSVAAGDRITVQITTADSPAGNGLQVSIKAVTA